MKNIKKTLSLFMVIITVFILCGNIKSAKAVMAPEQYIINDMGEAVLQIYQENDKDVVLPETVEIDGKTYPLTTIDENAFTWTSSVFSNIESIKISKNIKSINSKAFRYLNKLKKFIVDDENNFFTTIDDALYSSDKKTIVKYPQAKDSNIARVYSYAETISPYAFYGCSKLEEIKAYENIKNIGEYAFGECENLRKFTVPKGVTELKNGTFQYCSNLEELNLPSTLKYFDHYIINACYSLKEINVAIGSNYLVEENGCLYNKNKDTLLLCVNVSKNEEVIVPEGVTTICDYAFASCKNLKRIILPEGLKKINSYTFSYCENLVEINIPSTVKEIDSYAFLNCVSLENIDISDGVEKIGSYAFAQCDKLQYIKIPDSVKEIGNKLIYNNLITKIVCNKNSYAEKYANENNIEVQYIDDNNQYLRVYYHNLAGWTDVNIYAYSEEGEELVGSWPGKRMEDKGDGWWYYEIPSVQSARVMFNYPTSGAQEPAQAIPGYLCSGTVKIENGTVESVIQEKNKLKRVKVVYMSSDRNEEIADSITLLGNLGEEYMAPAEERMGLMGEYRLAGYYISSSEDETQSTLDYDKLISGTYSGNFTDKEITIYYIYDEAIGGNTWFFKELDINKQSPQKLGESLNVDFNLIGGVPEKTEYRLSYKMEGDNEWNLIKEYSYKDYDNFENYNVDWKPEKAGKYILKADVLGIYGHKETLEKEFVIEEATKELNIKSFSTDKVSPQKVETKVVLMANADGEGELQYKYYRYLNGKYALIKDWSLNNTVAIAPKNAGVYDIWVGVKDSTGKIVRKNLKFTFDKKLEIKEFKTDKVSPQKSETKVVLMVNADGDGNLQYKYYRYLNGKYALIKDWSLNNTVAITPKNAGVYDIWVGVKDSTGEIVRKNLKFTFN